MLHIEEKQDSIDLKTAIELFDRLADMEDLAFGYKRDGCYARAHIMCNTIFESGVIPKKAWAKEGSNGGFLNFHPPKSELIQWSWHVAPVIPVNISNDKTIDMIFDPAIFDGPATSEEWSKAISTDVDKVHIVNSTEIATGFRGNYTKGTSIDLDTNDEAKRTLEGYKKLQDEGQRSVLPSQTRQQAIEEHQVPENGKTWISENVEHNEPNDVLPDQSRFTAIVKPTDKNNRIPISSDRIKELGTYIPFK